MAETKITSQESSTVSHEMQPLEMKSTSNTQELDSPLFGSLSDTQDNFTEDDFFAARTTSDGQASHSVRGSRASTPTSGTDYQSCSNLSTPDRARSFEKLLTVTSSSEIVSPSTPNKAKSLERLPVTSASEVVSNVKMSANIANKLSQMRVSMENIDNISQNSFEEVDTTEVLSSVPHQDPLPVGGSPVTPRKCSIKPSLRQVFPYISCLPFENNIVFCFVLSVWDNIVGPQTVYVWKRKSFPSQKTFDGLLDEREGIEVAEESIELDKARNRIRQVSQQNEAQDGTANAAKEAGGRDQRLYDRRRSRKKSTASLAESYSQGHSEKQQHPNRIYKQSAAPKEKKFDDPTKNMCSEHYAAQSDVQTTDEKTHDNRGAAPPYTTPNSAEDGVGVTGDSRRPKPPPLVNFHTASIDSSIIGDPDGPEFSGSWACGRSRLRMASVVRYVTEHSVAVGQVGLASEKITSSLLVVPHQGIIIVAARFTVVEDECGVPYCLSMVVPLDEYDYFLPLTQPVTTWLITIAASTRLLITKHGLEGGSRVKSKLVELCDVLVALRSASLDQYPLIPAGRPPDDRRLAEIILTSHLQTLGSTVVVADSPNAANKVVMWIAQFSDPADLHVSRLCLSYTQWPFHPGLSIQGIVRSANGEVNLSAQKLIQSSRPLTVVDINRSTVKQTGAPDVHARRNSSALHQELLSLWHDLPDVSAPSESLLEPVRGAAPLVKRFLNDYDRLSSCEITVRQNFIQAFLRSLQYAALAIITWTQQEWAIQRRRSGYGSLRRALCSVFDLDDSDLRILLAQAELLQPGFYTYVMM